MKKQLLSFVMLLIGFILTYGQQVGIGTNNPQQTSVLELSSTNKGFLPPRMTAIQRDAISTATAPEGLVIYNTTEKCINYWNGTKWVSFCDIHSTSVPLAPLVKTVNSPLSEITNSNN